MKILKSLCIACSLIALPLMSSSTAHKEKTKNVKHTKPAPKKKVKKAKRAPRHKKKAGHKKPVTAPRKAAPKH